MSLGPVSTFSPRLENALANLCTVVAIWLDIMIFGRAPSSAVNRINKQLTINSFFTQVVDYDTRLDTLQHMVRAWLQMTSNNGIETWIAHGTLLGWWWNAKVCRVWYLGLLNN
jgi:hypothetical protein